MASKPTPNIQYALYDARRHFFWKPSQLVPSALATLLTFWCNFNFFQKIIAFRIESTNLFVFKLQSLDCYNCWLSTWKRWSLQHGWWNHYCAAQFTKRFFGSTTIWLSHRLCPVLTYINSLRATYVWSEESELIKIFKFEEFSMNILYMFLYISNGFASIWLSVESKLVQSNIYSLVARIRNEKSVFPTLHTKCKLQWYIISFFFNLK